MMMGNRGASGTKEKTMAISQDMNPNERALYELADRVNSPGYSIDPFLAASALPQNVAPPVMKLTGKIADIERTFDEGAARDAKRGDNTVTGPILFASPQGAQTNMSLPGSQEIIINLGNQLREAQEKYSNDPIRFAEEVSKIESTVAAKKVDFFKEAQARAFTTYGIPDLEKNLAANKEKDNAPWFRQKYGMVDSDETIAAQTKLAAMKTAADGSIRESLLSNKTYQELDTYHKSFAKLAEGSLNSSINRQEKLRVEAAAEYASYTVEERDLLDKAVGNTTKDPAMVFARTRLMSPDQKKMLNSAIVGGHKAIPSLALSGNPFAQNVALATETEVFGDRTVAEKKISEIAGIAASNELAMKTLINMGAPKDVVANAGSLLGPQAKVTGKAASEDAARKRQEIATAYAAMQTQKTFDSDVLSLKSDMPVPAFLQAARNNPAKNPTGKISLETASALAMRGTPEEQKRNRDELVNFYGNAAEKQNKSLFFKVHPLSAEKLKVKIALSSMASDFFNSAGLPGLGKLIEDSPTFMNEARQEPFGSLDRPSPQQLFEYNGEMLTKAEYDKRQGADYYKGIR